MKALYPGQDDSNHREPNVKQQVQISMPNFGPADGLNQYLQFSRQLGLLVIVVIFMGVVASERKEGLLSVLFVKPVSRLRYLSLRWAVNALYVLVSFAIGGGVAILYTTLLLGKPHIGAMGVALLLYLCYLLLVFSWTFFFSALFRQGPIAGGVSLVPLFVLPFLGALWKPLGSWALMVPPAWAPPSLEAPTWPPSACRLRGWPAP